ncbi:MAG: asparaginase [Deltaproteobacteria bacterium]|nr:asparaginase [Deltaproteobacteria bacterium]
MRLAILTTGGTIDKTYNESDGSLANVGSVLNSILTSLRHPGLDIRHVPVMSKDSLDLTDTDRQAILYAVMAAQSQVDAVVLIHGTDTLAQTGQHLHERLEDLVIPVILTGAMRPYEFRDTDAVQNVTEAVLAAGLLSPGVWVVLHGQALPFPNVTKDRAKMTFVPTSG